MCVRGWAPNAWRRTSSSVEVTASGARSNSASSRMKPSTVAASSGPASRRVSMAARLPQGVPYGPGHGRHLRLAGIALAGPEETAQPVAPAARPHVHVQVRDALADLVVDGHERALRARRLLHRPHQAPRVPE